MIERVALVSLEPWDDVWRRNQHLASRLVRSAAIGRLDFVTPPRSGFAARGTHWSPQRGVDVVTPPLVVPRRFGGHRPLGWWLRTAVRGADVLWVNDPIAGAAVARAGRPVVYDVTDDWRALAIGAERARLVAAEDLLAARATATVVCSGELARRWQQRYRLAVTTVTNGVDTAAVRDAPPVTLDRPGPHLVYVGTIHESRLDFDLVVQVATELAGESAAGSAAGTGRVHLVGPHQLPDGRRRQLDAAGVRLEGPVPADQVPSWLAAADVLICPHLVDEFTLSLDAIKAHEYLATDRPVVATPASGFAGRVADGLTVVDRRGFAAAVRAAVGTGPFARPAPPDWDEQAAAFAAVLNAAVLNTAVLNTAVDGAAHGPVLDAAIPENTVPDGTVPDGTVPDGTVPDGTVPDGTVPDGTVPDGTVPDGTVPDAEGRPGPNPARNRLR